LLRDFFHFIFKDLSHVHEVILRSFSSDSCMLIGTVVIWIFTNKRNFKTEDLNLLAEIAQLPKGKNLDLKDIAYLKVDFKS
ncbi:hypothetical protein STEG23_030946, partial [Scotinomys teguina]